MRYVEARVEQERREEAYRVYVTTSLQLAPQNKYITKAYLDTLERVPEVSGSEIVNDVMTRAGLSFGG